MTDITPLITADRQVIQSYAPGRFRISGKIHESPIIVFPDRVEPWPDQNDFTPLLTAAGDLDVVLVSAGPFAAALKAALKERKLVAEIMDTGAACRTYNVLMMEGRRVAAALTPIPTAAATRL